MDKSGQSTLITKMLSSVWAVHEKAKKEKADYSLYSLQAILEEKLAEIEKQKNEIISKVKQTAAKLKFTLKGSVSRDQEYLEMALQSSRDRLRDLEEGVECGQKILLKATEEPLEINVSRLTRILYLYVRVMLVLDVVVATVCVITAVACLAYPSQALL